MSVTPLPSNNAAKSSGVSAGLMPATTADAREIAEALGITKRSVERLASREKWEYVDVSVRGGKRRLYTIAALPARVQTALLVKSAPVAESAAPMRSKRVEQQRVLQAQIEAAWERFNAAPQSLKAEAERAASRLDAVAALVASGMGKCEARDQVAAQMRKDNEKGGSASTLSRWTDDIGDAPRKDWPALLLPDYPGRTAKAVCAPQLWDFYKGAYLDRSQASHESVYRRCKEMADAQGWSLPSARTLVRRMDQEVSELTQVLLREGPEALARRLPTRERDATVFGPGQAVNGDGLKFDTLWVDFGGGEIINTATGWFWQDVRTRKVLAWRLDRTENTDVFRLATYDLTAICAPEFVYIDNTRVAANKVMTAGSSHRHRFKNEPEDGIGLLRMIGMEPCFTNPDKDIGNPGAKPIERAFGVGGIHSEVRTNPRIVAIGGYSKATAVPVELLREVIAEEVERHNAREKRQTQACRGVLSFDQAWNDAVAQRPPRVLSSVQRKLLLMSREVVTIKKTGIIELEAGKSRHGRNSYHSDSAPNFVGQKVAVHFDPANLAAGVHVYSLDGRYLFAAEHRAAAAFNDTEAARNDSRWKKAAVKATKRAAELEIRRDAHEREKLYALALDQDKVKPTPAPQTVVEGHFQRVVDPTRDAARAPNEGGGQVVPMKRTGTADARTETLEYDLNRHLEALQQQRIQQSAWSPPEDR